MLRDQGGHLELGGGGISVNIEAMDGSVQISQAMTCNNEKESEATAPSSNQIHCVSIRFHRYIHMKTFVK